MAVVQVVSAPYVAEIRDSGLPPVDLFLRYGGNVASARGGVWAVSLFLPAVCWSHRADECPICGFSVRDGSAGALLRHVV